MPIKCLLYCTKAKPYLYRIDDDEFEIREELNTDFYPYTDDFVKHYRANNGKVVAECEVECEKINFEWLADGLWSRRSNYFTKTLDQSGLKKLSCLRIIELFAYLKEKGGYALHIKNLHIFDKPLSLIELSSNVVSEETLELKSLTKAPQNMCWCWYKGEKYCLISIRPEWLCKILNGNKTVEVRKKILKGMIKNEENNNDN